MPDPLSIALGVVQVAETGFKLADTIYKYTNSVRKAEEQFRPVADYVKLTCTVLEQIASHLQDEDLTTLYKPALLASAQDAIQGCEKAFDSLSVYLRGLTRDGSGTGARISTTTKFAWNWKRKELDNHQVHLERYKSTFDLLLSTLTFVSSSRTAKDTLTMKTELQRLMNVEAEAKRKEAMLPSFQPQEPPPPPIYAAVPDAASAKSVSSSIEHRAENSSRNVGPTAIGYMSNFALAAIKVPPDDVNIAPIKDRTSTSSNAKINETNIDDALLARLNECASAMEKLSATLNSTISQWQQSRQYQRESLLPHFQLLDSAIKRVSALELLDTRTGPSDQQTEPVSHGTSWFPELTRTSKNNVQMSRFQHFRYEPISPPGSPPRSPKLYGKTLPAMPDRSSRVSNRPNSTLTPVGFAPAAFAPVVKHPYGIRGGQRFYVDDGSTPPVDSVLDLPDAERTHPYGEKQVKKVVKKPQAASWADSNYEDDLDDRFNSTSLSESDREKNAKDATLVNKEKAKIAIVAATDEALEASETPRETLLTAKRSRPGCLTCRRRRVKCSEERPICQRCIKGKRECEGYGQQAVIKESNIVDKGTLSTVCNDMNFVGYTYKRVNNASEMSGTAAIDVHEISSKNNMFAQEDEAETVTRPLSVGSRSRSISDRSMSRSRSRTRSRSMSLTLPAGPTGVAAVGALAGYALSEERRWQSVVIASDSRRLSRSRTRAVSVDSIDEKHRDPEHRNARIAQAGLASATTAGLVERVRSKSREGRGRSVTRLQRSIPMESASLGSAALAGLYEKNRAGKDAQGDAIIGRLSARERNRSRITTKDHKSNDETSGTDAALAALKSNLASYEQKKQTKQTNIVNSVLTMPKNRFDARSVSGRDDTGATYDEAYTPTDSPIRRSHSDNELSHYQRRDSSASASVGDRREGRSRFPGRTRDEAAAAAVGAGIDPAFAELERALAAYEERHGTGDVTLDEFQPGSLVGSGEWNNLDRSDSPSNPQVIDKPHASMSLSLSGAFSAKDGENASSSSPTWRSYDTKYDRCRPRLSMKRRAPLSDCLVRCAPEMAQEEAMDADELLSAEMPDLSDVDELLKKWTLVEV